MSITTTTHLNFRGDARAALEFYQSVFGGQVVSITFGDAHNVQSEGGLAAPDEVDQIMWGQVRSDNGFHVMSYDVPSALSYDRGDKPVFVSVRGDSDATEEITEYWRACPRERRSRPTWAWLPGVPPVRDAHRPVRRHLGPRRPGQLLSSTIHPVAAGALRARRRDRPAASTDPPACHFSNTTPTLESGRSSAPLRWGRINLSQSLPRLVACGSGRCSAAASAIL